MGATSQLKLLNPLGVAMQVEVATGAVAEALRVTLWDFTVRGRGRPFSRQRSMTYAVAVVALLRMCLCITSGLLPHASEPSVTLLGEGRSSKRRTCAP